MANKRSTPVKIQFAPYIIAALSLLVLTALNMLLFFGRKKPTLRSDFLMQNFNDFYQHISNFSISLTLYSAVGFIWLMIGVPFRYIAALGIALVFINAVYELWIPILNTRDITDAYYGIAGVIVSFVFLALVKKYGLKAYNLT